MEINWSQTEEIKKLLVGKSIVSVSEDDLELTLSDGTRLEIEPNQGGCICGSGDYYLKRLNIFPNIITNVEVRQGATKSGDTLYQLFVYSEGIGASIADVSGDDGSGYYGTGFSITVSDGIKGGAE